MGLDVNAYKNIKVTQYSFDDEEYSEEEDFVHFYNHEDFLDRAIGIDYDHHYSYEDYLHIHAGSYSGYGRWRESLAKLAGYTLGEHGYVTDCWSGKIGPFSELINFSDCEGTLGTEVSKKLAEDFHNFYDKAKTFSEDEYFFMKYDEWKKIFEFASENGAVRFC